MHSCELFTVYCNVSYLQHVLLHVIWGMAGMLDAAVKAASNSKTLLHPAGPGLTPYKIHPDALINLAGHLTGLLPPEGEKALLAVFTGLALVFAARKYTQAVKDDIGDKSVFTCALSLLLDGICISFKGFVVEKNATWFVYKTILYSYVLDLMCSSLRSFLALPPAEQERRVAELQAEVKQRNGAFQEREVE